MNTATDNSPKIACLLISSKRFQLVLPNVMIQEVLPAKLLAHEKTLPEYIAGKIRLSDGTTINVLDIDRIGSDSRVFHQEKKPIVVLKGGPSGLSSRFGILANKTPKIVYCSEQNLDTNFNPSQVTEFASNYITVNNENGIIPDIEMLRKIALSN